MLSSPDLSLISLSLVKLNLSVSLAESAGVVAECVGVVGWICRCELSLLLSSAGSAGVVAECAGVVG